MPIMDGQLLFGESIDVGSTASGSTVISTNNVYIPKVKNFKGSSVSDRPFANGKNYFNVVVENEALDTGGGNATLAVRLMAHTAAITASTLAAADQIVEHIITVDASAANYPDGTQICSIPIPPVQMDEYLAATFTVATKTVTAGKLTAWIGPPAQQGGNP